MQLQEIRVKITPIRFHGGYMTGGEHVLMAPGEETTGSWIHYERRPVQPHDCFFLHSQNGSVHPEHFPEGQKQVVVAILHHPNGEITEHYHYGPDGKPVERHPLETE